MKLWEKGYNLDSEIEKFTVGNDFTLDMNLVKYDIYGSIAHAKMVKKIGILSKKEFLEIKQCLLEILKLDSEGKFEIKMEDEDVHTAIENFLIKKIGETGKKIHTARSRNDQVLTDIRLHSKQNLLDSKKLILELASVLVDIAEKYKDIPMPGYTHSRKAMPSSVGLYFSSFAESILDDLKIFDVAYELNDQCPLGSGAGYGIPISIDRQFVSDILGFKKVQHNSIYVQNSRGKIESSVIFALSSVMQNIARMSNDLILFSMEEFGFFKLPDKFCTGSSIMPQKKNPDVLELIRAKSSKVDANLYLVKSIVSKLQTGYNRDLQITKEPLIDSFEITRTALKIISKVVSEIDVNKKKCIEACTKEIFATEYAYKLVKKGIPFRDAYKKSAEKIDDIPETNPSDSIASNKNIGATGNLGLEKLKRHIKKYYDDTRKEIDNFDSNIKFLLK